MLNNPAEVPDSNNASSNNNSTAGTVNREAPKIIAPINLPGVMPRGNNDPKPEPVEDNTEDGNADPAPEADNGDEPTKEEEIETPRLNSEIEIEFDGKVHKFKNAKEVEVFLKKQTIIARGAQSKAAKDKAELEKRLKALEESVKGAGTGKEEIKVPEPSPESAELWRDVMAGFAQIEAIKDPNERARQQTILTASVAQALIEQAEERWNARLTEEVTPFKEEKKQTVEQKEVLTKANEVFSQVAGLRNDDDSPVYPELAQDADLSVILNMWKTCKDEGMPAKFLYHPDFVMMLLHTYRDTKTGDPNVPVVEERKTNVSQPKRKAPSTQLPPNLTKGKAGIPGMIIPGVLGRGY